MENKLNVFKMTFYLIYKHQIRKSEDAVSASGWAIGVIVLALDLYLFSTLSMLEHFNFPGIVYINDVFFDGESGKLFLLVGNFILFLYFYFSYSANGKLEELCKTAESESVGMKKIKRVSLTFLILSPLCLLISGSFYL
ncbi:hypothetical protein [Pleionea sp. CnH1-48]|uniref:hypothetical protein n=1 Tax=Pleionea sp. CnH1-48 TaxID=2954494 RepID=UPI00209748D0|nr:hypothetical protein [Pleionea sp. CnH1-48]MCO7224806.1 hypothetical protein [Pleionea sp. CnH1-48]